MTEQITRKRVQSARPFVERQRPLSSRPHQMEQKTQFIQKVYYNVPGLSERPSSGKNKMKINSLDTTKNTKLKESNFEKQIFVEQNILLKKKVNMLEMQISQLNGKMIVTRTKNSKNKKTLDVEFQNQTLWTGKNSYLVTGVKNQYEKLKAQYQQKCQQLSQLKQKLTFTRIEQLQKACKKLEAYSKQLLERNISLEQKINVFNSTSLASGGVSERNYRTSQLIIEELNLRLAQKQEKLQKKKQQISKHNQNIQMNNTRIKFLQKLALQKDNAIHALHLKNKKLQKEKQFYIQQINQLREKLQYAQRQSQSRISDIMESEQRRVNRERDIYSRIIDERNMNIAKLEKQVAYLTTLMSYWKPLDEEHKKNDNSPIRQINVVQVEQKKAEQDKNRKSATLGQSLGLLGRTYSQRISETNSVARQKTQIQVIEKPLQQKRADIKRSDYAKKVRPVRETEVEEIGQLMRFRLIAKRISINQVKAIFSKQIETQTINDESDPTTLWQNEYITMKQTYNILLQEPFNLSQSQAHLLSRYLIQDVQNDHIYCAWDNENKRDVVKSILKNTLKDYEVNESLEQIECETAVELQKYRSRISTILQQMYKDGFISKKKLSEIFVGSGFELRQTVMEYVIGKLAVQSQSLDRLKYTVLF